MEQETNSNPTKVAYLSDPETLKEVSELPHPAPSLQYVPTVKTQALDTVYMEGRLPSESALPSAKDLATLTSQLVQSGIISLQSELLSSSRSESATLGLEKRVYQKTGRTLALEALHFIGTCEDLLQDAIGSDAILHPLDVGQWSFLYAYINQFLAENGEGASPEQLVKLLGLQRTQMAGKDLTPIEKIQHYIGICKLSIEIKELYAKDEVLTMWSRLQKYRFLSRQDSAKKAGEASAAERDKRRKRKEKHGFDGL